MAVAAITSAQRLKQMNTQVDEFVTFVLFMTTRDYRLFRISSILYFVTLQFTPNDSKNIMVYQVLKAVKACDLNNVYKFID